MDEDLVDFSDVDRHLVTTLVAANSFPLAFFDGFHGWPLLPFGHRYRHL